LISLTEVQGILHYFEKKTFNQDFYTIIEENLRSICFSCSFFKSYSTIHKQSKFKTIQEVIIKKMNFKDAWLNFLLNEVIYTDESRIREISINVELIKMNSFKLENQIITFKYSNNSFSRVFKNSSNMGEVEVFIKYKAGIRNNVNFHSFGGRKNLKDEIVFEHQEVILKNVNCKYEIKECNLISFNLIFLLEI
jgi:hypothetical protein